MDFPVFRAWCQKVTPIVYDNSLSYYEILCKVVELLNDMIDGVNGVNAQIAANTDEISKLKAELVTINDEIEKLQNGAYISKYLDAIEKWIAENIELYVSKIAKFVNFGLTDDGYFVANIPYTWDFLQFDTIVDTNNEHYGCLVLTY